MSGLTVSSESHAPVASIADATWAAAVQKLRTFLRDEVGLALKQDPVPFLDARLRPLAYQAGFREVPAYIHKTIAGGDSTAHRVMVEALTTHTTSFFRERHHFELLVEHGIRPWVAGGPGADRPTFRIWSAACSTGQEPYSLAMVAHIWEGRSPSLDFRILATDVSQSILQVARAGQYPVEELATVPRQIRQLCTDAGDKFQIPACVRRRVQFHALNLKNIPYRFSVKLDAIFCRNVLIYFDRPLQQKVVQAMLHTLRPNGLIMLGHAEGIDTAGIPLVKIGPSTYRKDA